MLDSERAVRVQLAAAYRLVDYFDWTELIYGHLTARVPGEEGHFLINAFGLNYDEITASNLVKIDLDGKVVSGGSPHGVNYAGFVLHSAIHMQHSENCVVMHTHSRAGMAIAATKEGLAQVSMNSTSFHEAIAYHDYEGVSLYLDERERFTHSLGNKKAAILRNHGLLVVGNTVPETFLRLYRLERACEVQLDAAAAGTLNVLSDAVAARSYHDLEIFPQKHAEAAYGDIEFAALMRKLDKIDAGYRD
jgi:ribulose-5-phosphate 4-epimerase/fuculose-1-phosphate aldolase